jgi:hypothetical protein
MLRAHVPAGGGAVGDQPTGTASARPTQLPNPPAPPISCGSIAGVGQRSR